MSRKILKELLFCMMAFIFGTVSFMTASAADNDSISLSDLKQIVILNDNDLFNNMKELVPGDKVSNDVTITNNSNQEVTFYMYAEVKDSHKNIVLANKKYNNSLLSLLQLQLSLSGNVFYNGPVSGNPADARSGQIISGSLVLDKSKSLYGITLCKLAAKSSTTLKIDLAAPGPELGNDYQDTFTAVDWVFTCSGVDQPDQVDVKPNDDNPKTTASPSPSPEKKNGDTTDNNDNNTTNTTDTTSTNQTTSTSSLPKTGSVISYLGEAVIIMAILVIGLCVIDFRRKHKLTK
ncbi:hypothetical protein lbkm_0177 [Lachnospiraceae bacterium KM106-2]|nr:hypothetical protein lbkm_0177 [Lachnospiraceae bacterium KM106-2]